MNSVINIVDYCFFEKDKNVGPEVGQVYILI